MPEAGRMVGGMSGEGGVRRGIEKSLLGVMVIAQ